MPNTHCLTLLLIVSTLQFAPAQSEYVSSVLDYKPAPGQFVNTSGWGTPTRAASLIGGINGGISLGGFGGYIVVAFDHPVANDADNPFGIDFTVFGNPLADVSNNTVIWSEPGAVMVMKDENENGLPDDTWYELAGSDYYFMSSVKNYAITYINPQQNLAADVPWTDNQEQTGKVLANSFHLQPYYPSSINFPGISFTDVTFQGTCIKAHIDRSNPSLIQSYARGFGYADNTMPRAAPYTVPDNPYTAATENSGGDAFDIDWAVDQQGKHVHLDVIHFIKIYNAVNADAGWLGEVSTEIRGVVDVMPNASITGLLDQVVLADLPRTLGKNVELALEAYPFRQGILQSNAEIIFSVDKTTIAEITTSGTLRTKAAGTVTVTASLKNNPAIRDQAIINVVAPTSVSINLATTLRVNTRQEIAADVIDEEGKAVSNVQLQWHTSSIAIADIVQDNGNLFARGIAEGQTWLIASATSIPLLKDSVLLTILPESATRQVYLTIKDSEQIIYPRRKISVSNFDLNPYVADRQKNYGVDALTYITAAHAIATVFSNEPFVSDIRFRDNNDGLDQLYLWRLPIAEDNAVSYVYGYGGTSQDQHTAGWLTKINQHTFITGLQDIRLNEDDEVVVYHIPATQSPWKLVTLTSTADSVDTEVLITINVSKTIHSLTAEHLITTESSDAIQDEPVYINNNPLTFNGQAIHTDELGNVTLKFSYSGIHQITIAGSSIHIFVRGNVPVGTKDESITTHHLWPNPAGHILRVPIHDQSTSYEILDTKGNTRLQGRTGSDNTIDIESLPAGLYLLRLNTGRSITHHKFIKS